MQRAMPCSSASDANLLRMYINNYANHPNQLIYKGKQVVSTFSGASCTFGQGSLNAGWTYAVKSGVTRTVRHVAVYHITTATLIYSTF